MSLIQVTSWGEEHGLLKKIANSVQGDGYKYMTPEQKAQAEKKKKHDAKKVKARYLNSRGKHERLTRPYTLGAGEPIEFWHFIPDQVYDVYQGLVDEVNAKRPIVREGRCDENGENPTQSDQMDDPLHRFVPASF